MSLQIRQETLRFVHARKIGNQHLRFHLSKIIIFPEFPFIFETNPKEFLHIEPLPHPTLPGLRNALSQSTDYQPIINKRSADPLFFRQVCGRIDYNQLKANGLRNRNPQTLLTG